jgi:hypothetical protein
MSKIRFLNQNFVDVDVVSNSYVSSEQTAFPASNVYNRNRRSKVWRSNGYWNITTGSNTIIFRETIGVDLTATVAVAEYTSTTSLFTAIKAAFDAAGVATYTVSADTTTGKVKILSDLGGGASVFQLMWTNASSFDMAEILGFDITEDQTGAAYYIAGELRISTSEWFLWDMGISSLPRAFVLIGPRNSPLKIVPSAVLKLQGNETNVWTSPSYETTLTYNDSAIVEFNADGLHTEALRYWRLQIEDLSNPLGYVEIGSIFLGEFFEPTRGAPQFPFESEPIDRSSTIFSEGGQTFSDIREKSERFSIEMFGLTVAEKESMIDIFNDFGVAVPFFISFDPDAVFSSLTNDYVRFVKFDDTPKVSLVSPGVYTFKATFREEL